MSSPSRLPPSFTSLYRLFLRTTSASVLHRSRAVTKLRQLWKPYFRQAALVARRAEASEYVDGEVDWLKTWNARADRTLSLLYNSANTRGLPHDLLKNLAFLQFQHSAWMSNLHHRGGYGPVPSAWKSDLAPDAAEYKPRTVAPARATALESKMKPDVQAWDVLGDVVRMAEGSAGVSLGRLPDLRYKVEAIPRSRMKRGTKRLRVLA